MRNLLIAIMMVLGIGLVMAQPPSNDENRQGPPPKPDMELLQKDLGLSDDQVKQMEALHLKFDKEREAMRQHMKAGKEQREKMNEYRKTELSKILSDEQMAKLDQIHKQRTGHKSGGKECAPGQKK